LELKLVATFDAGATVTGVAQLHNWIFIVTFKSNVILVYDAQSFQLLEDIIVFDTENPMQAFDIAASKTFGCLYIFDYNNRCIWRLIYESHVSKQNIIKYLSMGEQSCTWKLSVTSQGQILILRRGPPKLDIYQPGDSEKITFTKSIPLPPLLKGPQHAVESPFGTYLISHGLKKHGTHRVCEIGKDGQILRSYGGQRGSRDFELDWPSHVAVDALGRVFVADRDNDRLLILDSKLNIRRVIQAKDADGTVRHPFRLCYVTGETEQRLLVGVVRGRVDVYSIRPPGLRFVLYCS